MEVIVKHNVPAIAWAVIIPALLTTAAGEVYGKADKDILEQDDKQSSVKHTANTWNKWKAT